MRSRSTIAASILASLVPSVALGTDLYVENFDVDPSASWTVNDPGLSDVLADFHYDYSGIGVPPAPGGTTTFGMKLTANNEGNVFSGFSVSPTGQSFSGDYTISFDLWQNYDFSDGSATQLSMFGFGTAGDVAVWPGSLPKESIMFAVTLDGGSAIDYRVYDSLHPPGRSIANGGPPSLTVYAAQPNPFPADVQNGDHPYYAGFGGEIAPAAQIALFPFQAGTTDAGEIAFAWRHVEIDFTGGIATWSVDGLEIVQLDTVDLTLGGGRLLFGHSDVNAPSSPFDESVLLNVTLIDNIRVVPEPGTLALSLSGIGGLGLVAVARRRATQRQDERRGA